jgi:hypothetical protein
MNKIKFFPLFLNNSLDIATFSALILDNFKINVTYCLLVKFIYYEPALNGINLDKPIIFKITESNNIKSINKLYTFLLEKVNHYNKNKNLEARVLVINYLVIS